MSMMTELINRLRMNANWLDEEDNDERAIRKSMLEAADTIQILSEKLHTSQMERSSQYYNGGWIPISEKLPEEYGQYICTMSNGDVQECGFAPSGEKELIAGWSTCEADGFKKLDYQDVIAWMPLPQSYQQEEDE